MAHPDSPFRLNVADLLRRPGSFRAEVIDASVPGLQISGSAVADPIHLDLTVESVAAGTGIVVHGWLQATWSGPCGRCLEPVVDVIDLDIHELFERDWIEGETYELAGDEIDLEPLARDLVLLELPPFPVHDEPPNEECADVLQRLLLDDLGEDPEPDPDGVPHHEQGEPAAATPIAGPAAIDGPPTSQAPNGVESSEAPAQPLHSTGRLDPRWDALRKLVDPGPEPPAQ